MAKKSVWNRILAPEEEVKFEFSLGKRYINLARGFWIILGILLLPLLGLGLILIVFGFLWGWYLRRANNFAFTTKRVLVLRGWLSTHLISVDYDKITDVIVKEPFFQRIFLDTGTLIINTAGTAFPEIVLENVENPYQIKQKLDAVRAK